MNHNEPPRSVTWETVGAALFLAIAVVVMVCRCTPHPVPKSHSPLDASDAAALLDVGPDAGECALFCRALALPVPACREANGQCVDACTMARADGLLTDLELNAAIHARTAEDFHALGLCK